MDYEHNGPLVDMSENFDVQEGDSMDDLVQARFSMPPAVIAAFRQAASKSAARLLDMVNDDAKFDKLRTVDKLKVMEMIFDRAYGKSETASTAALAAFRTGQDDGSDKRDHAAQLDAISQRAMEKARSRRPALTKGDDFLSLPRSEHFFPELGGKRSRGSAQDNAAKSDRPVTGDVVPIRRQRA